MTDRWQPIETAPNVVHVLLWFSKGEHVIGIKHRNEWSFIGFMADWLEEPTHWMPLPPGPGESSDV